jgi:hypothetical protein
MLPQMEGFHLTTVYFHPVNQLHAFIDRLGSELGMSSIFEVLHNVLIWDPNLVIFLVHRKNWGRFCTSIQRYPCNGGIHPGTS